MQRPLMLAALIAALLLPGSGCVSVRVAGASVASAPAVSSEDLHKRLDTALREFESEGFSGVVMVARGGERVLSRGYGLADRARGRAANDHTLFQLASVSKQFTAAAILTLQQEGRLRVTDRIDRYFDDVPADKRAITIHQLLTHTSGLPERGGECSSDSAALDRDDYVRHVLAAGLHSRPGTAYLYSNDGYGLLGAIIELASATGYEDYLRRHLFAPAGMTRTGYTFDDAVLADAAIGYGKQHVFMGNLNPTFRNRSGPAWCNRASGGLLSTAEDMYRWHLALRGDAVLHQASKTAWWTHHVPESPARTWFHGYGWALTTTRRGTRLAAHDGSLSGYFTADILWYLDEDVVVFVAANTAESPAPDASRVIVQTVFPARGADTWRTGPGSLPSQRGDHYPPARNNSTGSATKPSRRGWLTPSALRGRAGTQHVPEPHRVAPGHPGSIRPPNSPGGAAPAGDRMFGSHERQSSS